jgi:hypothetical protein
MKKIITGILIVMMAGLSACSSTAVSAAPSVQTAAATSATPSTSTSVLSTTYTDAVSVEEQLIVGTLALDGTANVVTKDQANTLLTLYTSLQSLTQMSAPNGNAAGGAAPQGTPDANATQPAQQNENQTKVDAVVAQIETAMTADQISAIAAMQITQTSEATILQNKGITLTAGGGQPGGESQGNGGANGAPAQGNGNAPQGTQPAANGTPDANQPQQGGNAPMGQGGNMVQPGLVNALVQYLANIAGVTVPTSAPNGG